MIDDQGREALLLWRAQLLEAGVSEHEVPDQGDLAQIAATPRVTRTVLDGLPLQRPGPVQAFAPEILSALRQARRTVKERGTGPAVPTQWSDRSGGGFVPADPERVPLVGPGVPAPPSPQATAHPDQGVGAAAPSPEPRVRASRRRATDTPHAAGSDGVHDLAVGRFAAHDLAVPRPTDVPTVHVADAGASGLRLVWRPVAGETVLYRVVSRDDHAPWSPDEADSVAITTGDQAHDDRPFASARRFYAVWAHAGDDEVAARRTSPQLVAECIAVAPPTAVRVQEDNGNVMLSWQVPADVTRVDVLRVPAHEADAWPYALRHRVASVAETRGYQDEGCVAGQEYEYRLFAVWTDAAGDERLSGPVRQRVRLNALLTPITSLELTPRLDAVRPAVELAWAQPLVGEVVVYRSASPPVAGAALQDIDVTALPQAGLRDEDRVMAPPRVRDGRAHLSVPWPPAEPRVHFTVVTLSGSTARVGATATHTRTSRITDARLVQRVFWQVVTFDWPPDVSSVRVHVAPLGSPFEDGSGSSVAVVSRADYVRAGGIQVDLPEQGCELHLVPVSFYERRQHPGAPASIRYEGLHRLRYRLVPPPPPAPVRRFGRRRAPALPATYRRLELSGPSVPRPDHQVLLTLAASRARLPLSVQDADRVLWQAHVPLTSADADTWQTVHELDLAGHADGYLRLFAESRDCAVALLDPDVSTLLA